MTYNMFDELPTRERDEMVADVMTYLKARGYSIFAPDNMQVPPYGKINTLMNHDREVRAQAIEDAAEIVMNGHGSHMTPLQLAVKLKNLANRVRAGVHGVPNTI